MHTSLSTPALDYNTVIKVVGRGARAIKQLLFSPYTYTARTTKAQTYTANNDSISTPSPHLHTRKED